MGGKLENPARTQAPNANSTQKGHMTSNRTHDLLTVSPFLFFIHYYLLVTNISNIFYITLCQLFFKFFLFGNMNWIPMSMVIQLNVTLGTQTNNKQKNKNKTVKQINKCDYIKKIKWQDRPKTKVMSCGDGLPLCTGGWSEEKLFNRAVETNRWKEALSLPPHLLQFALTCQPGGLALGQISSLLF